jgi:hypothetical protein
MFTSLRLERFKIFKDAELKLGPLTVLIGANASGKSTVRDAFRFLHGIGRGYSLAEIIGEKYGEGGERVWTGIRGGTPEIAFAGGSSFALDVRMSSSFPNHPASSSEPLPRQETEFRYRIDVEIDRKRTIPLVAEERFDHLRDPSRHLKGTAQRSNLEISFVSDQGPAIKTGSLPRTRPFARTLVPETGKVFHDNIGVIEYPVFRMVLRIFVNEITYMRLFD